MALVLPGCTRQCLARDYALPRNGVLDGAGKGAMLWRTFQCSETNGHQCLAWCLTHGHQWTLMAMAMAMAMDINGNGVLDDASKGAMADIPV